GGTIDTDAIGHQLPVGVLVQVYNFGADLLGQATGVATNVTDVEVGDNGTLHQLVLDGSELPATELPSLNGLPIPAAAQQRSDVPDVTQVLPKITDITELPEVTQLPEVTELPDADALQLGDLGQLRHLGQIGRAHVELQSRENLVCRLLLEKKKH